MEKVNTRKELIDRLEELKAVEKNARKGYEADLMTFTNLEIKQKIQRIKEDEDKHIKLFEEMIDMLRNA